VEGNATAGMQPAVALGRVRARIDTVRIRRPLLLVAVVAAYVAAGTAGIELEVSQGVITPVWAPTGIALTAVVLLGYRAWPAIALAAFLTNVINGAPVHLSLGIAAGNTLEAVAGAWLLRAVGFDPALRRTRDVLSLVTLAAVVSTAVSASVGTTTLWAGGELADGYGTSWLLWWFGDVMGDLLVASLLLVWLAPGRAVPSGHEIGEGAALLATLAVASLIVFFGGNWEYPYVLFPFLLWSALRFGQRGATTAMFVVAVMAIAATIDGSVAIDGTSQRQTVQIIQALLAVVGVPLSVLAAAIEERKSVEVALVDSLELHQAILQATADGILVVDDEGKIVSFNQQFADMWGIPDDVLAARDDERAIAWVLDQLADPGSFTERIRALYASDEIEDVAELRRRDDQVFERYSRPYRLEGQQGRVWSFRDVTAQRAAQDVKQRFLSMATHEMRTPLAITAGMSALLLEDWDHSTDQEKRDLLRRVRDQAGRLSNLVDDLLMTSAIESGRLQPRVRPLTLAHEVQRAMADAGASGTRVQVTNGAMALADADHVRQILVNLLTNAHKYGRPPFSIESRTEGSFVELRVKDGGDGIPADFAPHLFERFARAGAVVEAGVPGTGLGLSIARELARAQGGELSYETNGDRGATFCLRLPRAVVA